MKIRHCGILGVVMAMAMVAGQAGHVQAAEQTALDGVAASVNGEVITYSQVRDVVRPREEILRQAFTGQELIDKIKEARLAALKDLIDRQLVIQEFKKNGFQIPDYVVDQQIQTMIREQFKGDRRAFMKALAGQGITMSRFKQFETEKMIVQAMRARNVKTAAFVSPNKIQDYYQNHQAEYRTKEEIHLRLIALNDDPSEPGAKRAMAEEVLKKIREGAEFDRMAQLYSEDSSAELGGDWGWIDRTVLNEKLTNIAFSLGKGKMSDIIDMGGSYYILFVEERKGGFVRPLSEVRPEIERNLVQAEQQKAYQKWIDSLRQKAYVKIY